MEWVAFPRRHERRPSFHPRQEKTGKGNNSTKGVINCVHRVAGCVSIFSPNSEIHSAVTTTCSFLFFMLIKNIPTAAMTYPRIVPQKPKPIKRPGRSASDFLKIFWV